FFYFALFGPSITRSHRSGIAIQGEPQTPSLRGDGGSSVERYPNRDVQGPMVRQMHGNDQKNKFNIL
ncbi:hypothetical protein K443DRAFT_652822, partial [Laccaria amethystina LaAM-08-1]